MRKNTLIKLLAVLAMCFLVCAAFVACGNDEADDTAKVVAGVAFDADGNLVITYDDETTQKITLPTPAACNHYDVAKYTLEEHTATANGVYLEVCNDCGYSWIKYEQRHNWVEELHVEPATCKNDGYTTEAYCSICFAVSEKTNIVPAKDHNYEGGEYVIAAGKNICEDGGEILCVWNCGTTTTVAPVANEGIDGQHTVDAWDYTTNMPTLNAAGTATGTCTVCGETVTYNLPAILDGNSYNAAYTVVENARTSCSQALTATVTLKVYTSISYSNVEIKEAGSYHMLKDKNGDLQTLKPSDVYSDGYSTDEFAGIREFADTPINTCTPKLAYYVCEADYCDAVVDIYAYAEHDWAVTSTDDIVCGVEAFKHYQCPDCLKTKDESLGTRQHNYVYSQLTNVSANELDCDTFTYTITCSHENTDCPYFEVKTVTPADGVVVDRTTKPVTCEEDGIVYVSYTVPGTSTVIKCEVTDPKLGHILNGQHMTPAKSGGETPDADDVIYKYYEGCGVTIFADKDITAGPVLGYFICDHEKGGNSEHRVPVWVALDGTVEIVPVTTAP